MQKMFATSSLMKGIIEEVDIYKIELPKFQFRDINFENVDELSLSIQQHGLLNPIIVKTNNDGFQIVTGTRRYLSCKKLGWRNMICHIIEVNEKDAFEISLVENIQNKSLSAFEEARAFNAYVTDFGWGGISDLSEKISKSVAYIYKRLSMLDLPQEILDSFNKSTINSSTVNELIFVKDRDKQLQIVKQVIEKKLTIREIRKLVKEEDNNSMYNYNDNYNYLSLNKDKIEDLDLKTQRSFDKTITILKIALNKIGTVIENVEDNWIVYEILMQHKNMLNSQIDILIKEKRKL
jgi:ParB family chromosome partitioning protein